MPALIAPGVCRYAVNGTFAGRPVVNILDMVIDTTGTFDDRATAIFEMAGIVINEWSDSILSLVTDEYTAENVSWIDLNTADGSTGSRTTTSDHTWPANGEGESSSASGALAIRVNKNTVARRGQRQGRMYLVGLPEDLTTDAAPNFINTGGIAAINTVLASFLGDLNQSDGEGLTWESRLVVVHTKDDVYVSNSTVESLTVNPRLGTQVRRLRG